MLDFDYICINHKKLYMRDIFAKYSFTMDQLQVLIDFENCRSQIAKLKLTHEFIENNFNKLRFYLARNTYLTESFIEKHYMQDSNLYDICYYSTLSEQFIDKYSLLEKCQNEILSHQELSEDYIRYNILKIKHRKTLSLCQNLSIDFHNEFKTHNYIKKVVHHCGDYNRNIRIYNHAPQLIQMGCFWGNKQRAIDDVSKKYYGDKRIEYIEKINQLFEN